MSVPDGIPPQDLFAEQAVLGSMLIEKAAIPRARKALRAEDFYRAEHGALFDTILDLDGRGIGVDLLTVQVEAKRRKWIVAGDESNLLEGINGAPYLAILTDAVGTAAHVEDYAAIVSEKATLRRIIHSADSIRSAALTGELEEVAKLDGHLDIRATVIGSRLRRNNPFAAGFVSAADLPEGELPNPLYFGLYPRCVTLLIGETDAGKTSLLYTIAVHAARNAELWGRSFGLGRPIRVLYIDPENSGSYREEDKQGGLCAVKLERIAGGKPIDLVFHDGEGVDLSDPAHMEALAAWIMSDRFDMVIIDPIANLFCTKDENDNSEAARQMKAVVSLSRTTGASVIIVHHTGKDASGNYGRGASARLGAADVGMVLRARSPGGQETDDSYQGETRERNDLCRLQMVKDRPGVFGKPSLYLRMVGQDRFELATFTDWQAGRTGNSDRPDKLASAREEILLLIEDGEERDTDAFMHALREEGIGANACRAALKELDAEGRILRRVGERNKNFYRRAEADNDPFGE